MMKHFLKNILLINICLLTIFTFNSCHQLAIDNGSVPDNDNNNINIYSYLMVKGNPDIIKDCTPELDVFIEKANIISMSFSGNGKDWSEWVDYSKSYDQFNIASGFNGTTMESGNKTVYVRFKDTNGTIFPKDFQESVCCTFEYEMQKLYSIKIDPAEVEIKAGESREFMVKGFDLDLNEVPLDGEKVKWTKSCGVGELNPTEGVQTTYTTPENLGARDISAHYGSLGTGAKIYILQE